MSIKGFSVGGNVERYDYNFLDNRPSEITLDTALSDSSTNPVQNSAVTNAINAANGSISSVSGEVDDLKSAFNKGASTFNDLSYTPIIPFERGYVAPDASGFVYSDSTTRVRTPQGFTIHLSKGDKIGLSSYSGKRYLAGRFDTTTQTYKSTGWLTVDWTVEDNSEGDYAVMLAYGPDATVTNVNDLASLFFCNKLSSIIPVLEAKVMQNKSDITALGTKETNYETKIDAEQVVQNQQIAELNGLVYFEFESGYVAADGINQSFNYSDMNTRVRTKEGVTYHLMPGTKIGLRDYAGKRYGPSLKRTDNNTYVFIGWLTHDLVITVEGDYVIMLANDPDAIVTDINSLASLFFCEVDNQPVKLDMVIYNIGHFAYGGRPTVDGVTAYKYGIPDGVYADRLKNYKQFFCDNKCDLAVITEYSRSLDRVPFGSSDDAGSVSTKATLFDPLFPYSLIVNSLVNTFMNQAVFSNRMTLDCKAKAVGSGSSYNNVTMCHIQIGNRKVAVVCVHLGSGDTAEDVAKREVQIASIISFLADEKYAIIAGDFNTTAGSSEYEQFTTAGYVVANTGDFYGDCVTWNNTDAYYANQDEDAGVAWGDYYPTGNNYCFDNVIVTPNIKIQNFKVLYDWYEKLTSDHAPVIASLLLF